MKKALAKARHAKAVWDPQPPEESPRVNQQDDNNKKTDEEQVNAVFIPMLKCVLTSILFADVGSK
jgi:hypothetical protein